MVNGGILVGPAFGTPATKQLQWFGEPLQYSYWPIFEQSGKFVGLVVLPEA